MAEEHRGRAVLAARDVGYEVADGMLRGDFSTVCDQVRHRASIDPDLAYIFVVAPSGRILAGTFPRGFRSELVRANSVTRVEDYRVEVLDTDEGPVWDVAAPIRDCQLGIVRVGMCQQHMRTAMQDATRSLLLTTAGVAIAAIAAACLATSVMTKPILALTNATEAIRLGDFGQRVPLRGKDEVGRLSASFNAMVQALARSRDELEKANRKLIRQNEELHCKESSRQALLAELIRAHEDERARIARDLHDGVGQSLTALLMYLGTFQDMIPPGAERAKRRLAEIEELTASVVEEIRHLMVDLRPAVLDDLGLVPAISSYSKKRLECCGTEVQIEVVGGQRRISSATETALYRIFQEAIANIANHAGAQTANIRLCFGDACLKATIEDNGRGFDPAASRKNWKALGLRGLEERVALLGGTLQIDSHLGHGTRIDLMIPAPCDVS
jgi:signal transduction histidine kinase